MAETQIQSTSSREGDSDQSLNIIRTETVLSKLPIHNLSKKGSINIHILRKNERGQVELLWKVSPSRDHGEPRQLAYKLDTIVINRRIEEQGRPLPALIKIGSLREIGKEFRIPANTDAVKGALHQNAGAYITAKLTYKSNDGTERRLEAGFTRYSVIFTGEKLPDGSKADAVYIELHPRYQEVLNNAPIRPLDYDYLKELPPAAQRFYEVVSYRIFAALKHNQPHAKLTYSDFCTFSAQQRYHQLWKVKRQMTPIHRLHQQSGYLADVRYEETTDTAGLPDWMMYYTPGTKARAEYEIFTGRRQSGQAIQPTPQTNQPKRLVVSGGEISPSVTIPPPAPVTPPPSLAEQGTDPPLLAELTKRGIARDQAIKILKNAPEDQPILDQLEYGDFEKNKPNSAIRGAGFYVYLLKNNISVPDDFETTHKRRRREEAARQRDREAGERARLEMAYEDYKKAEIDRYIGANYDADQFRLLVERKAEELRNEREMFKAWRVEILLSYAERQVRSDLAARWVPFTNFETFCKQNRNLPEQLSLPDDSGASPATFAV